jgi:hypothetical protein
MDRRECEMSLEASIERFCDELRRPASRHSFMRYDRDKDVHERRPSNQFRGAFKRGWGRAEKLWKQGGDYCNPDTLRRLTWWNLGYRFVMWRHAEEQEPCDPATADEVFNRLAGRPPGYDRGREVEVPDARRLKYRVMTKPGARVATKAETKLVFDYRGQLQGKHHELKSWKWGNLQCDAYEKARNNLIEAKASCKREDIRMAVGELFDYEFLGRKDFKKPNKAILLPQKPDLESFEWLGDLKIYFVWKEKDVFLDNAKGQFI